MEEHNRHLNKRLENCWERTEVDSSNENSKILAAHADMNTYSRANSPARS